LKCFERVTMIRVLIVDDHPFVRACLAALLNEEEDIAVVGECADGAEVPAVSVATRPDVVLMDLRMPRISGIDATRVLLATQPEVRVVILTADPIGDAVGRAAEAGAVGFLTKGGDPSILVNAIRRVSEAGTAWPADDVSAA
jgi:DNA-binding NarL/FixJ family response regulator